MKTLAFVFASLLATAFSSRRELLCGDEICNAGTSNMFKGTGWQAGAKKFCLNDKPLDRTTLGHVSWSFLHTTAAYLPENLNEEQQFSFQGLFHIIHNIYACELCRGHFQKLMTDPTVIKELNSIKTRKYAVLFVWKVHNMVTTAQYPNRPLFLPEMKNYGIGSQTQKFTVTNGELVYGNASLGTESLHPYFTINGTHELGIADMIPTFADTVYDFVLKRWRAGGGLIPIASQFSAQQLPKGSKKQWKKIVAELRNVSTVETLEKDGEDICQPIYNKMKKFSSAHRSKTCPRNIPPGPIDLTLVTMSRCPFCAETMTSLHTFLASPVAAKFRFKNRYVLTKLVEKPTQFSDYDSLHGIGEVLGDSYELCAQRLYPKDWLKFVWCTDETYWAAGTENHTKSCCQKSGIDFDTLDKCARSPEALRYLDATADLTKKYKIDAAPTTLVGGKVVRQGVMFPMEWAQLACEMTSCQKLQEEEEKGSKSDLTVPQYEKSVPSSDFSPVTELFSESNQDVYKAVLPNVHSDGVVTTSEQQMLADIRHKMGITRADHDAAITSMQPVDAPATTRLPAVVGILGLIVVGIVGVWRKVASASEPTSVPSSEAYATVGMDAF